MLKNKQSQAAGAAVLLAIIIGLIIIFILLIPPPERAKLLGEKTSLGGSIEKGEEAIKKTTKELLLQETPGFLSYLKEKEIEKLIPSTHIFTKTKPLILEERDSLTVKKAAFSSLVPEIYFDLEDLEHVNQVLLDLSIESSYGGNLIILLNEKEIFNKKTNKFVPLKLPKSLLAKKNVLTFKVSSPGIAFWKTNQYILKNLKIVAEVIVVSTQKSKHLFYLNPTEAENIKEAKLRFSLNCVPEKKGYLEVKLNQYPIFSGVPENCGDLFYYPLPLEIIQSGNNWLTFKTEEGDYEITQTAIKLQLSKPTYPTYFFELAEDYFMASPKEEVSCGEIDGFCPPGCDEDVDKDCCFQKYVTSFWCDSPTTPSDDRCLSQITEADCFRCPSGYEDEEGLPPEVCSGFCGDDTDDFCPPNCSPSYDKDCCFKKKGEQFWCDDLPLTGLDFTCLDSLSYDECILCPSPGRYEGEKISPNCPLEQSEISSEEKLKKEYDIVLTLFFAQEKQKEADIYINGHRLHFSTFKTKFSRNINNYVKPWLNSLKIIPKSNLEITQLIVELRS